MEVVPNKRGAQIGCKCSLEGGKALPVYVSMERGFHLSALMAQRVDRAQRRGISCMQPSAAL